MESLGRQLNERREASRARMDDATRDVVDGATAEVAALRIVERSLAVGGRIPRFELPGATGETVRADDLLERGPLIVTFYRGGWCPYCNLQLRAYAAALDEFRALSATIVAVSPETPDMSLTTTEKNDLPFPVLSDVGNRVAREFGLVFTMPAGLWPLYESWGIDVPAHNGDDTHELPVPATYVVGTDGLVAWRFVDPDYTRRAEVSDLLDALRSL